jgi:glycosyltransferase involved in cell wall biosynthesis
MAPRRTLLLNGPTTGLSSFAIVNRRLAAGLTLAGYDVWRGDVPSLADIPGLPDVCLTNGHPYDVLNAPGRVNVFQLSYDYARFTRTDRSLKDAIDARFDLCAVPSRFVRDACRASGVERPVVVCPHGVDLDEFHPGAAPAALPTRKRFRFVYVGGATERKGVDVLLEAFAAEFSADDDVALVLKTFSYEHLLSWFAAVRERVGDRGPEIVHVHGDEPSIAGYFTAADVGVFPFRGEAFALPILECLATGTPVIVTRGGGPADYCTPENAELIRARRLTSDGKRHLEPDVAHLRQLMRGAYERRDRARNPDRIHRSIARFTWERAVATLVEAIETCRDRKRSRARSLGTPVVHAYGHVGRTSWKKVAAHVDAALHARFETQSVDLQIAVTDFAMSVTPDNAAVAAGQSSRHIVTIAPQLGVYNSAVTLSCSSGNLPPQTTCAFDPPTVIPGASGATSALTISTVSTASASASAVARARAITTLASGIGVFPSAVSFASQTINTTAPAQLVSLTNTGVDALNVTSISTSGDFASVSNCGTVVAPGATCGVSVTFTPTATGARTGTQNERRRRERWCRWGFR